MIDIIIPVYNTPINDLKRCLDSIFAQSFNNYLVYIIDDGSNCDVRKFLDDYIVDKSRFMVEHISNGGVANARNVGIEISKSKYLTFVDSDDTIERDFLEEAYRVIMDNDLDIVIGGYNEVVDNKINKVRKCVDGLHIYDNSNKILFFDKLLSGKIRDDNKEIDSCPVGRIYTRLYKRSVIDNVRFNKKVNVSEDTLFMIDIIYNVNRIGLISSVWYNYYQNDYSIVHSNNYNKLISDSLVFLEEVYKRMSFEENLEIKNAYGMRILKTILNIDDILKKSDIKFNYSIYDKYINNCLVNLDISNYINMSSREINLLNSLVGDINDL